MKYHHQLGVVQPFVKAHTKVFTASVAVIFAFLWYLVLFGSASAAPAVVTGDTFDGTSGWTFGAVAPFDAPFEFNEDESSVGNGSLYVGPVGADPLEKFIAYHAFDNLLAADLNSVSYDFLIGSDVADTNEFYLNVYTLFPAPDTDSYYNCRFDFVPSTGSTLAFETAVFESSDVATFVGARGGSVCPTTWDSLPAGSTISFLTLNVGDTSANDVGVNGYYDNVVVDTELGIAEFDFDPDVTPPEQVDGMTIFVNSNDRGCYPVINTRSITVDWNDSAASDFDYYMYQADADTDPPYDFTTTVGVSERSGTIRDLDGTYNYRVAAVDMNGNQGEWSEWCGVTLDRERPDVSINSPVTDEEVSGMVDVLGTIEDDNAWRHRIFVYDEDGNRLYRSAWVLDDDGLANESAGMLDSTALEDGLYRIRLRAQDEARNSRSRSVWVEVDNRADNKDECKNGGWVLGLDLETPFRNQGDCVSHFASETQAEFNPDGAPESNARGRSNR